MICSKCGAPLPAEALFCPNCGERTLVPLDPDTDTLEDDLLLALLEEEEEERERQKILDAEMQKELQVIGQSSANRTKRTVEVPDTGMDEYGFPVPEQKRHIPADSRVSRNDQERRQNAQREARYQRELAEKKEQIRRQKKKKKMVGRLIALIIVLVVLVGGIGYYAYYRSNNSVEYLMSRADAAYDRKDYQNALNYVEKALEVDSNNIDALIMEGKIDYFMLESDNAENIFKHVLQLDNENFEAYTYLLKIYSDKNAYNDIVALKEGVTDPDILALFDEYMVPAPTFDVEAGTYNEYITVKLSSTQRNLDFYYTLDGTTPTKNSDKYTDDGVKIEQQGEVILTAISVDAYGHSSEEVSVKYTIELLVPNTPVVDPDGGQFTSGGTITITADPGCKIYYTWDGTDPTEDSFEYTAPIWMWEGNNILSVIAIDEFGMESEVLQCNFIYYPPVVTQPAPETTTTGTDYGVPMDGE